MADVQRQYDSKKMTCAELAGQFRSGDRIGFGVWYAEPYGVINAINALGDAAKGLHIACSIATCPSPYMRDHDIVFNTAFQGAQERMARAAGQQFFYTPINYCDGLRNAEYGRPCDYHVVRVSPMDETGMFNFSMTCSSDYRVIPWLKANRPKTTIVFEVNPKLPCVPGLPEYGNNEHSVEIPDIIVEDDTDLLSFAVPEANDVEQRIAKNVANLVEDRATIQIGFGSLPMAIGASLKNHKELGIHTEMLCEAHIDLLEAGAATNAHKGLYDGLSVATFALGTARLHDWIADNPEVALIPVEEVNRPDVHPRLNKLTSVNSVLAVDMCGQTMAHCIGPETYSGLGGAFEFAYGAQMSPGGKSIVCLPSTTTKSDGSVISNIVAQFPMGTRVTTPEHVTDWVVTEYGAAHLKFLPLEDRARCLVELAHPDFREGLEREMMDAGLQLDKLGRLPARPEGRLYIAE